MANPTFDSTALTTNSARSSIGSPPARIALDDLPGVTGSYVNGYGRGSRTIAVIGYLEATGESKAAASTALLAAVREKQDLADGATIADFVGTDGHTYEGCLLLSYSMAGVIDLSPIDGADYTARVAIRAAVVQLDPTETA